MKSLINQLCSAQPVSALIIGDVVLDDYIFGTASQIAPEAPVLVVKEGRREQCLGGAANVAANCKHIGMHVDVIGFINRDDDKGQRLLSLLKEIRVNTRGIIKTPRRKTTYKQRIMAGSQQCLRVDRESERQLCDHDTEQLIERINQLMRPGQLVMLSDHAKGILSDFAIAHIVKTAHALGNRVIADPKGSLFSKYHDVDYVKANLTAFKETIYHFGLPMDDTLVGNARYIIKKLGIKGLGITKGEQGIHFVSKDDEYHAPAYKREVFDLSGAGDTAFAFLGLALANKLSVSNALMLANRAASVAVSHVKSYAVSLEELIDREAEPDAKIMYEWSKIKMELDWLRIDGRKVIFVSYYYDILTKRHVDLLREAKKFGDILVVGINSDLSIRTSGQSGMYSNSSQERASVIASLGIVDFVVLFDQEAPRALLEYLRPDVYVQGSSSEGRSTAEYEVINSYGGVVQVVDCATTTRENNRL